MIRLGWSTPTPIQSLAIPLVIKAKDIVASASTGSGKTGAFMLPILHILLNRDRRIPLSRVLVVLPTRLVDYQSYLLTPLVNWLFNVRV
jgi:superfamily II DNA/RNA helicase